MRIEAKDLSMRYESADSIVRVFENLNLTIESGASAAVIGESGAGKSTLLSLLGALEEPVAGDVILGETSIAEERRRSGDLAEFRGRNVGFVFQFHYLLPEFDAVENVAMPLIIQGHKRPAAKERAAALLERVGLAERFTHRPAQLSGGEQQRVAIARALVAEPGVVLADEPTGNLDLRTGGEIQELLMEMQREAGTTLVVATHSIDLARSLGRVVEMTGENLREVEV